MIIFRFQLPLYSQPGFVQFVVHSRNNTYIILPKIHCTRLNLRSSERLSNFASKLYELAIPRLKQKLVKNSQ